MTQTAFASATVVTIQMIRERELLYNVHPRDKGEPVLTIMLPGKD